MAPATSCFISRKRICRWRPASISSTDSPPGWPTMNGVPASLKAAASTSTVVATRVPPAFPSSLPVAVPAIYTRRPPTSAGPCATGHGAGLRLNCARKGKTRKKPRGGADAQDGPVAAHGHGSAARARGQRGCAGLPHQAGAPHHSVPAGRQQRCGRAHDRHAAGRAARQAGDGRQPRRGWRRPRHGGRGGRCARRLYDPRRLARLYRQSLALQAQVRSPQVLRAGGHARLRRQHAERASLPCPSTRSRS